MSALPLKNNDLIKVQKKSKKFEKTLDFLNSPCYYNQALKRMAE